MRSTENYLEQINKIKDALAKSDAVVIGAGAGLSASAGLTYSGERFEKYFADFIAAYHFTDMYSAGFYAYQSLEEYWAYWSRHIFYNRYDLTPGKAYCDLSELVKDKDYFVITTNVDHQFQLAGFEKKRLFYMQGDYGLWQCATPCHAQNYDNEQIIRQMIAKQSNMRIATELIPHCPKCGKPMTNNLRCDSSFVQDEGWYLANARYEDFIRRHKSSDIVFLELGVGGNTPAIIKYPFWNMTLQNSDATYITVNLQEAICHPRIETQSICIRADIGAVLSSINTSKGFPKSKQSPLPAYTHEEFSRNIL